MHELSGGELEVDAEDLVVLVSIGDNFVVLAQEGNDEGIEFYIL
jgi:hypothetical protein